MLLLVTVNSGKISVFKAACSPNQNPPTSIGIKAIVMAVLKYSFFQSLLNVVAKLSLPFTKQRVKVTIKSFDYRLTEKRKLVKCC